MVRSLTIILVGALFGAGLAVGGMLNPAKVAGFLDIFGVWDPSLAFVMGGGVVANLVGMRFLQRGRAPLFASSFRLPDATGIDRPGPAISSLVLVPGDVALFVVMMLAGLFGGRVFMARRTG